MRCPRCHHIDRADSVSCSRCGFEFHQVSTLQESVDVRTDRVPVGPLQDFELRRPILNQRPQSRKPRRTAKRRSEGSLPRSRPLSVRRTTPDVPKFRARDLALPLESTPASDTIRNGAVHATTVAGPASRSARLLHRRFAAGLLDLVILATLNAAIVYLTVRLADLSLARAGQLPVLPLSSFLLLFDATYLVVLTAFGGQTIGKMVAGLRVERRGGEAVSVVGALARNRELRNLGDAGRAWLSRPPLPTGRRLARPSGWHARCAGAVT